MKVNSLAKKYAKALFNVAVKKNNVEMIVAEYDLFLRFLEQNRHISKVFSSPDAKKRNLFFKQIIRPRFSVEFSEFLNVVLKNRRHYLLLEIFEAFKAIYISVQDMKMVRITTAIPLTSEKIIQLEQQFNTYLKSAVRIENIVEASIIGGIIIQIDDRVYDASIMEKFNKLKLNIVES